MQIVNSSFLKKKQLSLRLSLVAHQAGTYLWFPLHEITRSIYPGWDTRPS